MIREFKLLAPAAIILAMSLASTAHAEVKKFSAELAPEGAVVSHGKGKVWGSYDTSSRKLIYKITWSGLTGKVTAAHFHGPASAGENAGVLVPINGPFKSSMSGSAKVDAKTAQAIMAGKTYLNLHTAKNPNGEIRAQVEFAHHAGMAMQKKPAASSNYGSGY